MFVTTKLWNNNHRPERVKPAFEASRQRLRLDYVDCYLVHTPFAVLAADRREPGHVGQTEPIRNAAAAPAGDGSDLPLKILV